MEARQRVKLSLTNRSIGLISLRIRPAQQKACRNDIQQTAQASVRRIASNPRISSRHIRRQPTAHPGGWSTWWSQRGARTRSHPELGRENPPRQWYCVLRRGRVGRRQVHQPPGPSHKPTHTVSQPVTHSHPTCRNPKHPDAGWSSPVARQAHNLKVAGSNPAPATISAD